MYEGWDYLGPILDDHGRCRGAVAQNLISMEIRAFPANAVIIASGGCGLVYGRSTMSMACTVELVHRARTRDRMDEALKAEYRFGHRIVEMGDFREGIRAAIIDKDKSPKWQHARPEDPTPAEVSAMLQPLGADELKLEEST